MFKAIDFSTERGGPLDGVRIIDMSRLVAGNMLTMTLADLGADVIKVESHKGDTLREWRTAGVETVWKAYSRNKRSLCLDLKNSTSRAIVLRLVKTADVLVESFRPGTLESMGLSPETLLEANSSLIVARISGWGQSGPYAARPGFGTLVEGMSGFASMNGFADREPVLPPIYLGDMTAGLYGAIGILAALREVEVNGGHGQVVDISLLDSLFSIIGSQAANYRLTGEVKQRTGSRSTNSAPRNVYLTADEHWVCLSASTQSMAERLFRTIDRPELITDPRFASNDSRLENVADLDAIISAFIRQHDQQDCLRLFEQAGVTVGPIYDVSNIEEDQHFNQRQIVVELPDRMMGVIPVHNISPRLTATPGRFRLPAPTLGEQSQEILQEAGYDDAEVATFLTDDVVRATSESSHEGA